MPNDNVVHLMIARMGTEIVIQGVSGIEREYYYRLFHERYAAFFDKPSIDSAKIDLLLASGSAYLELVPGPLPIFTNIESSRLEFLSVYEKGWYDLHTRCGKLEIRASAIQGGSRPSGDPENFLRAMYAWRCLEQGSLLLHAAGLVRGDQGYVFFGHSGSGKTTITSLSPDTQILSDDLVILRVEQDQVMLYGVPFRGEMTEAPRLNLAVPLKGLFALRKAGEHRIETVTQAMGVGYLSACVPFVMGAPEQAGRVLQVCNEIVGRVPVQELYFRRDPGFWSVIDEQ